MKKKFFKILYIIIIINILVFASYKTVFASATMKASSSITGGMMDVTSDKMVDIFESLGIHKDYYQQPGNKEQVLEKMNNLSDADLKVLSTYEYCTKNEDFMNILVQYDMGFMSTYGLDKIYEENPNYLIEIAGNAEKVYKKRYQAQDLEVDKIGLLEDLEQVMTSSHTLEDLYEMQERIEEYYRDYRDVHGTEDTDSNLKTLFNRLKGLIEDDEAHPEDDLIEEQIDIREDGLDLAKEGYFAKNNAGITLSDLYEIEKSMGEYREEYKKHFNGESDYIVGEYLKDVQALIRQKGGTPTVGILGGEGNGEGSSEEESGGTTVGTGSGSTGTSGESDTSDTSEGDTSDSEEDDDEDSGPLYTVSGIVINPGPSGVSGSDLTNPADDPDAYRPGEMGESATLLNFGGIITGALKIVGIIAAVVIAVILGIKYMTGTIQEKAEYKKTMVPYIIGAAFLGIGGVLIELIYNLVTGLHF